MDIFISNKKDKDETMNAGISHFPQWCETSLLNWIECMNSTRNFSLTCYAIHSVKATHRTPFCLIGIMKIFSIIFLISLD